MSYELVVYRSFFKRWSAVRRQGQFLAGFLKKIEDTHRKARRVWVVDRGVPSEAF